MKRIYMTGLTFQFLISWLILRYVLKTGFSAIGFSSGFQLIKLFLVGVLGTLTYFCMMEYILAILVMNPYKLNPSYTFRNFTNSASYIFISVMYEELIFRGALLLILIRKLGVQKALVISSICFGIYHWFSWNSFGNPIQMLIVFTTTGSMGYILAMAFARTESIFLPVGMHLGMNLANMLLFSKSENLGTQLLLKTHLVDPIIPNAIISLPMIIIYYAGFQLAACIIITHYFRVRG